MIDLESIYKQEVETKVPSIHSIVVNKTADIEEAKGKIEEAGFSVESMEELDSGFVFKQGDVEATDQIVLKYDDISVVVSHVSKEFQSYNFETLSFTELHSQEGVVPSILLAKESLCSVMLNVLHNADNPADAKVGITAAVDEFKSFVVGLIDQVPVQAFKFESGDTEAQVVKEDPKSEGGVKDDTKEAVEDEEAATNEDSEDSEDEEAEDETEAEDKDEAEVLVEKKQMQDKKKKEKTKKDEDMSEIMESLKKLTEAVSVIPNIQKGMEDLSTEVKETAKLAKSADEALSGVVVGGSTEDAVRTSKQETNGDLDFINLDTAYGKPE